MPPLRPRLARTLVIAPSLRDELVRDAELHAPSETGGVLLGSTNRASRAAVVEVLVEAGPNAQREPHRFEPDGPWQRQRIAELYETSGRRLDYLGDWHSHPQGGGPSGLDRSTARGIAETPAARCPSPIFLIVTYDRGKWQIRAYLLRGRRFRRLRVAVR